MQLTSSAPAHLRFFLSLTVEVQWKGRGSLRTSQSVTAPRGLSPIELHLTGQERATVVRRAAQSNNLIIMKYIYLKKELQNNSYNIMQQKTTQFEVLSPRKIRNKQNNNQNPPPPRNYVKELLTLLLPPFLVTILSFLFRIVSIIVKFILSFVISKNRPGDSSCQFNKRRYEEDLEDLDLAQQDLGFTNQVLVQEGRKSVTFYVPTFVACKIKSIQDVSVHSLTGNISCALLVYINYGDMPDQIVNKLSQSIILQLNRGQAMLLKEDGLTITLKMHPKDKFMVFTIRKVFLAFMLEDTLWSPFEVLDLVISITFNTVNIPPHSLKPLSEPTGYDPKKEYKISFNCMRNSDKIPISFALDCVYGVYDLAERRLESYHSRLSSYSQIIKNYEEWEQKKIKNNKKQKDGFKKPKQKLSTRDHSKKRESTRINIMPPPPPSPSILNIMKDMAETTVRRLSMRMTASDFKNPPKKVKYFQYTHLVIPLYKYPGNVLITIFLPVMLLALLSLAIFFQEQDLSGRIGSIATMILGYIALIPSIKQRLPPSAKLTVIQALVYIETLCCMFCLYQSFMILDIKDYQFVWQQNAVFLSCLAIHSCVFLFILSLYCVHKLKWEPSYNYDEKIVQLKPIDNQLSWDNPYCDKVFLKYNEDIRNGPKDKIEEKIIKIYVNPTYGYTQQVIGAQQNHHQEMVSFQHFEDAPKEKRNDSLGKEKKKRPTELQQLKQAKDTWLLNLPMSPRSMNEFVPPTEEQYYGHKE